MTYEESYKKCKTLENLRQEVISDLSIAMMYNSQDRIKIIKESAEKVANEKFKESLENKE